VDDSQPTPLASLKTVITAKAVLEMRQPRHVTNTGYRASRDLEEYITGANAGQW